MTIKDANEAIGQFKDQANEAIGQGLRELRHEVWTMDLAEIGGWLVGAAFAIFVGWIFGVIADHKEK